MDDDDDDHSRSLLRFHDACAFPICGVVCVCVCVDDLTERRICAGKLASCRVSCEFVCSCSVVCLCFFTVFVRDEAAETFKRHWAAANREDIVGLEVLPCLRRRRSRRRRGDPSKLWWPWASTVTCHCQCRRMRSIRYLPSIDWVVCSTFSLVIKFVDDPYS